MSYKFVRDAATKSLSKVLTGDLSLCVTTAVRSLGEDTSAGERYMNFFFFFVGGDLQCINFWFPLYKWRLYTAARKEMLSQCC